MAKSLCEVCPDLIAVSQPAHLVTELSPVEQHGCPRDTCPGQCTALAPFQELQVDSADPCASPEEGCSHPISLLARTCPWDGTLQSFVCLPFPGSSAVPWGLVPEAASPWSSRGSESRADPRQQECLTLYSSFYLQPWRLRGKGGYYCTLLANAVICLGARLTPVGWDNVRLSRAQITFLPPQEVQIMPEGKPRSILLKCHWTADWIWFL